MTGNTHLTLGVAAALGVQVAAAQLHLPWAIPQEQTLWLLGAAALGGILPDIDHEHSTASNLPRMIARSVQRRSLAGAVLYSALQILNLFTRLLSTGIRAMTGGHRGGTHTYLASAILALIVAGLGLWLGRLPQLGLFFWLAYLAHLEADACTRSGTHPWRPFSDRRVRHGRIRTGSVADRLLGLLGGAAVVALWYIGGWM